MGFGNAMPSMAVHMAVVVMMLMAVRFLFAADSGLLLQFLCSSSVENPGVCTSRL